MNGIAHGTEVGGLPFANYYFILIGEAVVAAGLIGWGGWALLRRWENEVTISIGGITTIPKPETSYQTYLKMADAMLYDAKRLACRRRLATPVSWSVMDWYSTCLRYW